MLRAIPADLYESAQEILEVVMNPPVSQLFAFVPKNQQNAEQIASTEECATIIAIYIYIIYVYIYMQL